MGEPGDEERIHQLAVEMLRVLHFYQFTNRENELSGVHLLGGGAAKEALHRQIAETIEFPVLSTEKLMPAILQGKGEVAACVQAAGAALWKGGES
jgi:type IV pilus assembly protein PilM